MIYTIVATLENSVFIKIEQKILLCLHIKQEEAFSSEHYKEILH